MVQVVGAVGEMIGNHAQVDAFQVACADVFLDLLNQLVIPSALLLMQPLIGKQQNFLGKAAAIFRAGEGMILHQHAVQLVFKALVRAGLLLHNKLHAAQQVMTEHLPLRKGCALHNVVQKRRYRLLRVLCFLGQQLRQLGVTGLHQQRGRHSLRRVLLGKDHVVPAVVALVAQKPHAQLILLTDVP